MYNYVRYPVLPLVWDVYDDNGAAMGAHSKLASGRLREDVPYLDWAVLIRDEEAGGVLYPKYACGTPEEAAVSATYLLAAAPTLPAAVVKVAAANIIERITWSPRHSVPLDAETMWELELLRDLTLTPYEAGCVEKNASVVKVAFLGELLARGAAAAAKPFRSVASRLGAAGEATTAAIRRGGQSLFGGAPTTLGSAAHAGVPAATPVMRPAGRPSVRSWAQEPVPAPARAMQEYHNAPYDEWAAAYHKKYPALAPTRTGPIPAPPPLPVGHEMVHPDSVERIRQIARPGTAAQIEQMWMQEGIHPGHVPRVPAGPPVQRTMGFGQTAELAPAPATSRTVNLSDTSTMFPAATPGYAEAPTVQLPMRGYYPPARLLPPTTGTANSTISFW